jgi:DNA polymerase-1
LLRGVLKRVGFDVLSSQQVLEGDEEEPEVYYTNTALCMPPPKDADQYKTSNQKKQAARCCFKRLVSELKPYAAAGVPICAMGGAASMVMVGNEHITKIRSRWWSRGGVRVLTTWHPAYILRTPNRVGEMVRDLIKLKRGKSQYEEFEHDEVKMELLDTPEKLWAFARWLDGACSAGEIQNATVCIDIETDNVNWWEDQLLCIGFAWSLTESAMIPDHMVYKPVVREVLTWLFDREGIKWLGHNFKFDCRFIRHQLGVENVRVDYDSLIADYVVDENRWHALKELLTEFYDVPDYEGELVQRYLNNRNDRYSKVPRNLLYEYCAYDVVYTIRLWRDERRWMESKGLFQKPFLYPLMASMEAFLDIELHGMLMDRQELTRLSRTLRRQLAEWHGELCELAGISDFNPNSPQQVSRIMYVIFKMPTQKVRGLKPTSTAEAVRKLIMLEYETKLSDQALAEHSGYRWITLYDGWKKVEKIRSSYVDNLIPLIDQAGRVHPDILMHGTETGRPSVRNPALQTIPRTDTGRVDGELWGKRIKLCFTVPEGYKMLQVDYSQAELRTAASLSGDPFLIQCYKDGRDLHGEVANAFWPGWFTMSDLQEKKYRRKRTKMCVFGRLYLGGVHTVAETMHCRLPQARIYLAVLDGKLGGLVHWERNQFATMRKQGYVETLTGRRRRVPMITRNNREDARKAACNAPVQGMASDLTLISMIEVHKWLKENCPEAHILVTVHDSIIFEVPEPLVRVVALKAKEIMEDVGDRYMPNLPWKADIEVGDSWGDLKEIELVAQITNGVL